MRTIGIISSIVGVLASSDALQRFRQMKVGPELIPFILSGVLDEPDPCRKLCWFDGPQICTDGSWTIVMSDGSSVCHGYHRIGPERHCYHTLVNGETCPARSPYIKPSEVGAIIDGRRMDFDKILEHYGNSAPKKVAAVGAHASLREGLTSDRVPTTAEYIPEHSLESNLASFCTHNAGYVRDAFLRNFHEVKHVGYPKGLPRWSEFVGSNLPSYCPDLLNQFPELVPVVIELRMYQSVSIDRPGLEELRSLKMEEVSRAHAFTDSIQAIKDHDPVALRLQIHELRFAGDSHHGPLFGREFVSLAAEEIFKAPKSVYFKDAGDGGVIEILETGELDHFEAIGRFIGLSLAHDVSLGVRFPESYVSLFIGRDVKIALKQEVKERLDLMVKGFHAVVPPVLISDFITVERLASTFLGTPVIDVNDLIANMRFSCFHDVTQQSRWLSDYLHSLSQEELKKFTRLLCGRSVGPVGGFDAYRPHLMISFLLSDAKLPEVSGYFLITVPLYEREDELIEGFNALLSRM